jgi:hypothetical protein
MALVNRIAKLSALIALFSILSSCALERMFPGKVAVGVARLTVNNLGKLVVALNDPRIYAQAVGKCRLDKMLPGAKIQQLREGFGHASWDFKDCVYDFGKRGVTLDATDTCGNKTRTTYYGKVTVSGQRTINGILTGNPDTPVIPSGFGGVKFSFTDVAFQEFRVESPTQEAAMTMVSGHVAFDINIHLGKDKNELCQTPIPNPTLSNIRYFSTEKESRNILRLPGLLWEFEADVSDSDMTAQVGTHENVQNFLLGKINLWGDEYRVPSTGTVLDPSFTPESYAKSLTCVADLQLPAPNHCSYEADLAKNLSRLTVINLGGFLAAVILDPNSASATPGCDLASLKGGRVIRTNDHDGRVEWDYADCIFDFGTTGKEFKLEFAQGATATIFGKVTLSGKRHISGRLTGNADLPVIPDHGNVYFNFSKAAFENFKVTIVPSELPSLNIVEGALSFDLTVHLEKEGELDVYKKPLPNLTFENIRFLKNTRIAISNMPHVTGDFNFVVNQSNFHAQLGHFGNIENAIEGSLSLFGRAIDIPASPLDPRSPSSQDKIATPSGSTGSFAKVEGLLADGSSRLTIYNLSRLIEAIVGHAVPSVDARPECNLRDLSGTGLHVTTAVAPNNPDKGKMTWHFSNCEYDLSNMPREMAPGNITLSGRVILSGERSIEGFLTHNLRQPIVPSIPEYLFHIAELRFENFKVDDTTLPAVLTMASGSLSLELSVPLEVDPGTRLFSQHREHLSYQHIRYTPGSKLVVSSRQGEIQGDFDVPVSGSDFGAQLPPENKITGTLSVFGNTISIPADRLGLSPERTVGQPVPRPHHHDGLENFEALMIARLLILNMSTIVQEAYAEDMKHANILPNCGFGSNIVRVLGTREGRAGFRGRMRFGINNCEIINQNAPDSLPDPCTNQPPLVTGIVRASGTQNVEGKRSILSITPDTPHSVDFDFSRIEVNHFKTYFPPEKVGMGGGLFMHSGTFQARVHPILAEKKEEPCNFSRTTPIAEFDVLIDSPVEVALELLYHGHLFFRSKPLTINAARFNAKNGVFNGTGNYLGGSITVNGGIFTFDPQIDKLDPFYSQQAFDDSYRCRTTLERGAPYYDEFAIKEILPHQAGWAPSCPATPVEHP